jgi:hypothetical protein
MFDHPDYSRLQALKYPVDLASSDNRKGYRRITELDKNRHGRSPMAHMEGMPVLKLPSFPLSHVSITYVTRVHQLRNDCQGLRPKILD